MTVQEDHAYRLAVLAASQFDALLATLQEGVDLVEATSESQVKQRGKGFGYLHRTLSRIDHQERPDTLVRNLEAIVRAPDASGVEKPPPSPDAG